MTPPAALSSLGALVRRADPDRFLTTLFAPADRREALFTLYAFNHETARAWEMAREPMMAMIRLQWWREVVEGTPKQHEVATPLSRLLGTGVLRPGDLLPVVEARERTEFDTLAEWRAWLIEGPGALAYAAGRVLGATDERLRMLGAAYGAAGVLRSVVVQARGGICLLPRDVLAQHGLTPEAVVSAPDAAALHPVVRALLREGRSWLGPHYRPGPALPAALPAVFARRDLRQRADRLLHAAPRGLGDRLAVTVSAMLGRV